MGPQLILQDKREGDAPPMVGTPRQMPRSACEVFWVFMAPVWD